MVAPFVEPREQPRLVCDEHVGRAHRVGDGPLGSKARLPAGPAALGRVVLLRRRNHPLALLLARNLGQPDLPDPPRQRVKVDRIGGGGGAAASAAAAAVAVSGVAERLVGPPVDRLGSAEAGKGLLEPPRRSQHLGERHVRLRVERLDLSRAPESHGGGVEPTLPVQQRPKLPPPARVVGTAEHIRTDPERRRVAASAKAAVLRERRRRELEVEGGELEAACRREEGVQHICTAPPSRSSVRYCYARHLRARACDSRSRAFTENPRVDCGFRPPCG